MLFNYKYVPHAIEQFQSYLDHLVKSVWCRANGDYSIELLLPNFKAIVEAIANDESITNDYLDGPIKTIDGLFKNRLTAAQRTQFSVWYDNNNDIEALCANDPGKTPVTYDQVNAICPDLARELKKFWNNLFTNVIGLSTVTDQLGDIDSHYKNFVAVNKMGKCPYCGFGDIMGQYNSRREAYDHYIPKGKYPFNALNFRNLAPMCHQCNSSYKLTRDPLQGPTGRRKAFYSYAIQPSGISVSLVISATNIDQLVPACIQVQISAPGRTEELGGWEDLFKIEERFKSKCCAENDGKYWVTQVVDECKNVNITATEMLAKVQRSANASPWAECNFLKAAFLSACHNAALIG